jgi:hypothetical protein
MAKVKITETVLRDSHQSLIATRMTTEDMLPILEKMDKVIGYPEVADIIAGGFDGSLNADGSIDAELQVITGATNEMGFNKLSAR